MPEPDDNPMHHPEEQPTGTEGSPKFGRLLLVLALAVAFVALLTYVAQRIYA
jgi:hypothetical protein